jgi:hypothetical protein
MINVSVDIGHFDSHIRLIDLKDTAASWWIQPQSPLSLFCRPTILYSQFPAITQLNHLSLSLIILSDRNFIEVKLDESIIIKKKLLSPKKVLPLITLISEIFDLDKRRLKLLAICFNQWDAILKLQIIFRWIYKKSL